MLSITRTFGDEKAELRELNSRLDQYLSRVRQLEAENKLLVGEIQKLRVERGREWAHGYEEEIKELRSKVEELNIQKCEAEIQRENLWQELQSLQELWDQVRAMRLRIDQQLVQYKQDLQQAIKGQAALEELHNHLLQECHMLRGSQHEELVVLRERALTVPVTIAMQETVHPRLSMQDMQSFSLELSESWKETFLLYQKKIEELESYVIVSEKSRQEAEEEAREQVLQVVELRREYEELMRMRKMLEEELLRMKEKCRLEMEDYQIIIEELEQEKQTVTVTITDRLQDYHELMKLKTSLSLEVAAYRALLEAESQKGTITWIDQSVKNRPAGYITTYFDQSQKYSGIKRGEEKKHLPLSRTSKDMRTMQASNIPRFQPRKVPQIQINTQSIDTGRTSRFYTAQDKSSRWDKNISPRYEFSRNKDISKNTNPTDHSSFIRSTSSMHSGSVNQQIRQEQVNYSKPSIITKPQPAEILKYQVNTTFDSKTKELQSQNTFESKLLDEKKLVDERKATKSTEGEKSGLEFNIPIVQQREVKSVVTIVKESTENKDTIEPKIQKPPVKERKKSRQAQKTREESESKEDADRNTVHRENLAASHSVQKKNIYIFRGKPETEEAVLEIPMQYEVSKREENQYENNMEGTRETEITINTEQAYEDEKAHHSNIKLHTSLDEGAESVEDIPPAEDLNKNSVVEDILKHFGQSSGSDDANVTYIEKKEQDSDGSVKTKIFLQTKTKEEVDFLDKPDLTDLLNTSSYQRIQEGITRAANNAVEETELKEKETIIGEGKGVEDWIENIIQNELKGRSGVSFNVEVIEESTGAFITEKSDFVTPFHVEEVEDNIKATESACGDDKPQDSVKAEDLHSETQVQRHAEEVTEGGDEETTNFISVPDDIRLVQDEEQETLRCQIHIEDSHVKYSWQDEFFQGSKGQKALSELVRYARSNESETIVLDNLGDDRENRIDTQQPKSETFVIEKEIKIPHEFQSSIIGLFSKDIEDPQQLKGTLECLQGSLPENIVAELSALTEEQKAQDSSLAVDIKKVDQPTDPSMTTIVAEINLSQTIDADKLDTLRVGDNIDKTTNGSFSTKVELPHKQITTDGRFIKHIQLETSERINQAQFISDNKEKATEVKTSPISTNRSIHHITFEPREMLLDEKKIYEGTMSEILELDISKGAEDSPDYSRPIRHITLSPTETYTVEQIVFEGPILKTVSSSGSTEDFPFGELPKDSTSHNSVHDNFVETEDPRSLISNESINQTETITGGIKTVKHYTLNARDTEMIEGAMPKVQLHQETDNLEENIMPTKHRIGSQKIQVATQVKHQGFVSEPYKVADSGKLVEDKEKPNVKTLVHHIKLSPNKEQIVFEGPISSNVHISSQEDSSQMEVENRSIKHIILGAKEAQTSEIVIFEGAVLEPYIFEGPISPNVNISSQEGSSQMEAENKYVTHIINNAKEAQTSESDIFEGLVSESYVFEGPISSNIHISSQEGSSQMEAENRSITHIILGAKEAQTSEKVLYEGPLSESYESWDLSPSGDSSESERSIKHIKLGPTEKSFTFQMDITEIATKHNAQGDVQGSEIVLTSSNFERLPGTSQTCSELTDDLEVAESGYGEEDTSGVSQYEAEIQSHSLSFKETPAFEKTVHVQRIAQQSSLVSDDNKVAIVYLDEEERPDQDYLQRSF